MIYQAPILLQPAGMTQDPLDSYVSFGPARRQSGKVWNFRLAICQWVSAARWRVLQKFLSRQFRVQAHTPSLFSCAVGRSRCFVLHPSVVTRVQLVICLARKILCLGLFSNSGWVIWKQACLHVMDSSNDSAHLYIEVNVDYENWFFILGLYCIIQYTKCSMGISVNAQTQTKVRLVTNSLE